MASDPKTLKTKRETVFGLIGLGVLAWNGMSVNSSMWHTRAAGTLSKRLLTFHLT